MGGFRVVCGLVMGMAVCVWGGVYAAEPTIPLYLYNGNVGVGTETPQRLFHVGGDFQVGLIPTMSVVVTSAGRLGVGTTSPTELLHVVGNLRLGTVTDMIFSNNIGQISSSAPMSIYSNSETIFKNTSEVEFLRITNTGLVGVGTLSPAAKFHIEGSANNGTILRMNSGTNYQGLNFAGSATIGNGVVEISPVTVPGSGTAQQYTHFKSSVNESNTGRTEHGVIVDGKVGIGTREPSEKLSVNGALGITASEEYVYLYSTHMVGSNSRVRIRAVGTGGESGHGYGGDFRVSTRTSLNTWNDDAFVIDSAGRVGIGTTSPTELLHVVGNLRLGTVTDMIFSNNIGQISSSAPMSIYSNSETIFKNTSEVEFLRITNTGLVGIGTSAPTARLEVVGSAFINGGSLVNKNPNGPYYGPTIETDYPGGWAREYGFTRVGKTGKLFSLGVLGSGDSFNYGYIGGASSSETSHASPWMVFLPSGNVGVGTASPGAKLHVAGNIVMGEGLASGAGIRIENRITSINVSTMGLIAWGESGFGAAGDLVLAPRTSSSLFSVRVYTNGPDGIKERVRVAPNGNLGIGTATPTQPLHVSGNALITSRMAINAAIDPTYTLNVGGAIRATELVVNLNGWADYVFEPGYPLMPLSDVESFVKQNRHLPGMPSEAALKASGLNMAKVQTLQMQKIEELTLYVIELNKQNKALEARLEALEKGVAR